MTEDPVLRPSRRLGASVWTGPPLTAARAAGGSWASVVSAGTAAVWALQERHPGDHERLFRAVARVVEASTVIYPGSFVDLAASVVWPDVTYVDVDRRAARFFADLPGIEAILAGHGVPAGDRRIRFLPADYTAALDVGDGSVDLLLSLYAGPVSESCTRYLRVGGALLAHPSHGDVALASLDPRLALTGVVQAAAGDYTVGTDDLDGYLEPRDGRTVTRAGIHRSGRGIAYRRRAFAHLFTRVR